MEQINNNNRCCATCVHWLGFRIPDRLDFVRVTSKTDSGRCRAKGLNESRTYQAIYCCHEYRKW